MCTFVTIVYYAQWSVSVSKVFGTCNQLKCQQQLKWITSTTLNVLSVCDEDVISLMCHFFFYLPLTPSHFISMLCISCIFNTSTGIFDSSKPKTLSQSYGNERQIQETISSYNCQKFNLMESLLNKSTKWLCFQLVLDIHLLNWCTQRSFLPSPSLSLCDSTRDVQSNHIAENICTTNWSSISRHGKRPN